MTSAAENPEPVVDHSPTESLPTRERILQAAAKVFAAKGYHGTGMADLGKAANIQRGALYYHIGSKEDLLFDLIDRSLDNAIERGRAAIASTDNPIEQFRALAKAHVRDMVEHRADWILSERERYALTGERRTKNLAKRHQHQDLFEEVYERCMAAGVFRKVDSIEVMSTIGMLNSPFVWLKEDGQLSIDAVADRMCDLLLAGLTAD